MVRSHRYDAFLSYKHGSGSSETAATRGDSDLARLLHRHLHSIARPFWKLRALHVFRDEAELAAGADLPSRITEALDHSGHLLLLLSPEAARSEWVGKEILAWLSGDPKADRLIIALTAGDLHWKPRLDERFGTLHGEAVPPELAALSIAEPQWVDLRAYRVAPNGQDAGFRKAAIAIAARLHGCTPDQLDGRDHLRLRQANAAMAVGLVLLGSLAAVAWWQRERALDEGARARAGQLAVESRVASERDPREAAPMLVEALQTLSERDLPIDYEVEFALRSSANSLRDEIRFDSEQMSVRALFPDDNRLILVSADQVQSYELDVTNTAAHLSALPLTDVDGYPLGAHSAARLANGDIALLASNWSGETRLHRLTSATWTLSDQPISSVLHPAGLAVNEDQIYISDRDRGIFVLGADGQIQAHWPMVSAGLVACNGHEPCVVADRSPDFAGNAVMPGSAVPANARLYWFNESDGSHQALETPHAAVSALIAAPWRLLSGGSEGLVQEYRFDQGRLRREGEPRRALATPVTALASTEGRLAAGGRDGLIRVWGDGEEAEHDLRGHVAPIRSLVFEASDPCRLWSASDDGQVRRWDLCWPLISKEADASWERQSPNGEWLVRSSTTDIERMNRGVVTRTPVPCAVAANRMVETLAISNRGDVFAKCPGTQENQSAAWVPAESAALAFAFPEDQYETAWFVDNDAVIAATGSFMTTIEGIDAPPGTYPARLQQLWPDGRKAEIDLRPHGMALVLAPSKDGSVLFVGTQNGKLLTVDRARFAVTHVTELGSVVDQSVPTAAVKALACCSGEGSLAIGFGVYGMPSGMAEQMRDRLVLFDPMTETIAATHDGERRSVLALNFLSGTRLAAVYGPIEAYSGYGDSARLRLFDKLLRPLAIDTALPGAMYAGIANQSADVLSLVSLPRGRFEITLGLDQVETRVRQSANEQRRRANAARRMIDIDRAEAAADYDQVKAIASAWIAANPDDPEGWQQRGRAHLALGEFDDAAANFEAVLERNPWNLYAPLNAAKAYAGSEDWAQAEAMAGRAIERAHLIMRPPAMVMASDHPLYAMNRMTATAVMVLQRGARVEPLLLRAKVRLIQENLPGARADLEEVVRLGVENDDTRRLWQALQQAENKANAQ